MLNTNKVNLSLSILISFIFFTGCFETNEELNGWSKSERKILHKKVELAASVAFFDEKDKEKQKIMRKKYASCFENHVLSNYTYNELANLRNVIIMEVTKKCIIPLYRKK